jgi:predicted nuclease of restriction endonuclease-like (RecB) superfamily
LQTLSAISSNSNPLAQIAEKFPLAWFMSEPRCPKIKQLCSTKGAVAKPEDAVTPDEAIKDPYVLEFLNLKDEYSESDLEQALIQRH